MLFPRLQGGSYEKKQFVCEFQGQRSKVIIIDDSQSWKHEYWEGKYLDNIDQSNEGTLKLTNQVEGHPKLTNQIERPLKISLSNSNTLIHDAHSTEIAHQQSHRTVSSEAYIFTKIRMVIASLIEFNEKTVTRLYIICMFTQSVINSTYLEEKLNFKTYEQKISHSFFGIEKVDELAKMRYLVLYFAW